MRRNERRGRRQRSEKVVAPLVVAFLLAVAAAGAIGLSSVATDVDRVRAEAFAGAETLARELAAALDERVAELAASQPPSWAVTWRADALGALMAPPVGPPRRASGTANELVAGLTREVDALDRDADRDGADARLLAIAGREDRPELAAWALSWLAARTSDRATRRAFLERLERTFGAVRDERGLAYGHAARAQLLALDGDPIEALVALHRDLLADRRSLDDAATTALAERIAARVLARAPRRADELARARAASDRPLALFAEWARGPSNWIASGAPGGVWYDAVTDGRRRAPARLIAARASGASGTNGTAESSGDREPSAFVGAAVELERLVDLAYERAGAARWHELGYGAQVLDASGAAIGRANDFDVGAADTQGADTHATHATDATDPWHTARAPVALGRPRAPLAVLTPRVVALDVDRRTASERRRFALTAAAFAAAMLVASVAGFTVVRSVRRQARAAREREAFVAAVTHELRSPVASIRLLAELLEREDTRPEHARDFARRTVAESERLARLVDSVLRFAGDDAREPAASVELAEAIETAVQSVAPLAAERGFEVRVDTRGTNGVVVRAERDGLIGAIAELVDNATKYGAPAAGVDVRVRCDRQRARVEVLDRGPGVPVGERERVFEPFRRLGDEMTREARGIGLGLALVRRTVEAVGGSTGCDGRQGGGARLWLELPLGEDSPRLDRDR